MGDVSANILDLAGIVCNRNTIPGDKSARTPSGIRLGTPWITQRGFKEPEVTRLAEIIAKVLKGCRPHATAGRRGPVYSARIDFDVLEEAKRDVVELACCADLPADYNPSGYPHHYFMYKQTKDPGGEWDIIEIDGPARPGLLQRRDEQRRVCARSGGEPADVDPQPRRHADERGRREADRAGDHAGCNSSCRRAKEARVAHWLRSMSDGFVTVDLDDEFVAHARPGRDPPPAARTRRRVARAPAAARASSRTERSAGPTRSRTGSATAAARGPRPRSTRRCSRCPSSSGRLAVGATA